MEHFRQRNFIIEQIFPENSLGHSLEDRWQRRKNWVAEIVTATPRRNDKVMNGDWKWTKQEEGFGRHKGDLPGHPGRETENDIKGKPEVSLEDCAVILKQGVQAEELPG